MAGEKKVMAVLTTLVIILIGAVAFLSFHIIQMKTRLDTLQGSRINFSEPPPVAPLIPPSPGRSQPPAIAAVPTPDPGQSLLAPDDTEDWFSFDLSNPFREMQKMQQRMDRMFDETFRRFHDSSRFGPLINDRVFSPNMDLREESDRYILQADIPGMEKGDIKVQVEGQKLTISGKREEIVEENKPGQIHRSERQIGKFERSIMLPGPVKEDQIEAKYENGVLTIVLLKTDHQKPDVKEIPIR